MKNSDKKEAFELIQNGSESITIKPLLPLNVANAMAYNAQLSKLDIPDVSYIYVDLDYLTEYDSFLVVFYKRFQALAELHNAEVDFIGGTPEQENLIQVFLKRQQNILSDDDDAASVWIKYLETIGRKVKIMLRDVYKFTEFMGNLMLSFVKLPTKIKEIRVKDFVFFFNSTGVNAVPITLLIVFLLGLIMGYQGAALLKQFGADRYIADLVGIVLCRELGPLMTAILVAGRSGSAFAAEIGTMKVSEEIDAIRTMGIDLYQFIIVPRVLSVTLSIPFVTILADLAGIIGGYIAAAIMLDMTFTGYVTEMTRAMNYAHVFSGIGKSMIFGFLVASVGCFRGMQASGGAESVGKFTTAAVVTGVLFIILSDAVFTFLFQTLGI